ncbi:MAG: aminomethyltransferase family protein [Candidatus Acidiferrales bacterium]
MPIGTALHERVMRLCESLNFRDWAGYYAASVYETHHEHEYNAIRNAAAMIDVSPLFKYRISGPDAARFINRVITRDIERVAVGGVIYCCWSDEQGKVIDDGTISRLAEDQYRWTAAEPNLRWFHQNSLGLDVKIEDISHDVAALAIQGPTSSRLLQSVAGGDIANLKYFRVTRSRIAGVDLEISRTGYTGDLGYEIWMPWRDAARVWDALVQAGGPFDLHPAGMLALDVARIEAGLILIDVDYTSSRKALVDSQKYSPYEIGLGRLVDLRKEKFIGREALAEENRRGPKRSLVGLELNWDDVERLYDAAGLAPQVSSTASRIAVPVYQSGEQIGKATSTTWSPALKKMLALASVSTPHARPDTELRMEITVEAVRHKVRARVRELPFFHPARKTATPPL